MRSFTFITALFAMLLPSATSAQSIRQQFVVPTPGGEIAVEGFGGCPDTTCPAVLILGGSRGFGTSVYDEIGQTFRAAGLNAYLVHVLSPMDLDAIANAGGARARIAYYAERLQSWTSSVESVAAYLKDQPLGPKYGAQSGHA